MDGTNNFGIRSDATSLSAFDETFPEKATWPSEGKDYCGESRLSRYIIPSALRQVLVTLQIAINSPYLVR